MNTIHQDSDYRFTQQEDGKITYTVLKDNSIGEKIGQGGIITQEKFDSYIRSHIEKYNLEGVNNGKAV